MESRYQINRALSVRVQEDKTTIHVGFSPPFAIEIQKPPKYLKFLIQFCSSPHYVSEIVVSTLETFPGTVLQQVIDVIHDLLKLGLLQPEFDIGRYDRHQLYFGLQGIKPETYIATLKDKHVGLIGTGGIGSTVGLLLAAAGVGTLTISDGDFVEESNLTRSILFDESDIDKLKVIRAKEKLEQRNNSVKVIPVAKQSIDDELIDKYFSSCDLLLLSADPHVSILRLFNNASLRLDIPYLSAGYVEAYGSIGPMIIPGSTACLECNILNGLESFLEYEELNTDLKTPSYGPLNSLVSSIAANEVIRYLLNLTVQSVRTRIMIDSQTYERRLYHFDQNLECDCVKNKSKSRFVESSHDTFNEVAKEYGRARNRESINALALDELMLNLLGKDERQRILDIGCGIGTIAIPMAEQGHLVTAIDSSYDMIQIFKEKLSETAKLNIEILHTTIENANISGKFDKICLNMVINHIRSPLRILADCAKRMNIEGQLIISIPHPFKDSGYWKKELDNNIWSHGDYIIENYFTEATITKSRETENGELVIKEITSYKRTLSSYFSIIREAGLIVEKIYEPRPNQGVQSQSVNFYKASRMPYFLVFLCKKPTDYFS